MNVVTRRQWGARAPRNRTSLSGSRGLVCHYNGPRLHLTAGCRDGSRCKSAVQGTQRFHMDARGWSDIAYNFLVCPSCGRIYEGRGWGHRSAANGTNTGNSWGHAVTVLIGEGEPLTTAAKKSLTALAKEHRRRYGRHQWRTHNQFKATACPGPGIRSWVRSGATVPPDIQLPEDDMPLNKDDLAKIDRLLDNRLADLEDKVAAAVFNRLHPKGGAALGDETDLLRQDTRLKHRLLVAIADKIGVNLPDADRKPIA